MPPITAPITIDLLFERNTKNNYVYRAEGFNEPVRTLYIHKSAFGTNDPPTSLVLTITEGEDE